MKILSKTLESSGSAPAALPSPMRRKLLGAGTITGMAALSAFTGRGAFAQKGAGDYPVKPVNMLVPFAPGGTVDLVARLYGQKLTAEMGQSFLIDNRGGAGGTIGTAMLARAPADGYTVMMMHMGLAFNAGLYDKLPYDTAKDILPVAYVGATPNVLVVNSAVPVHSVAEFLALARAKPGGVNYGSGGLGSAGHVPMEVLQASTGIKLAHIPYKGSGPAIVDLMSGQVQCMLLTIPAVMPFLQSGKLRAIATSGRVRTPALPDIPTLQEAGVTGFEYTPWYGLFAPAATPKPIVEALHAATNKAVLDPGVAAMVAKQGLEVQAMSQQQFAKMVAADIGAWSKTIQGLGLRGEA